jgi:hypothetical protein
LLKKTRGFANRERQVIWWPNFSSTVFEEEVAGAYAGRERWSPSMHVLKHAARIAVYADALQRCVDSVASRNIPHPCMAKSSVASLEFCY